MSSLKNIWVPLSGQIAQQRKVETIANNVANANTIGFKKDQLAFKEHLTALSKGVEDIDIPRNEFSPEDFYRTQGGENAYVKVSASHTIFEQGQLIPTQNALDIGLKGDGFLEVLTPHGVRYTRKGNLSLSKDGELVTDQGFKILRSEPIESDDLKRDPASLSKAEDRLIKLPTNQRITISTEGEILTKEGTLGKISIVEFKDIHSLRKEGQSLFINQDELNAKRTNIQTLAHQGFLEGSNVNAIEEMSELIKAHRHFESIQKAINAYDNISNKAVNEISKF